MTAMTKRLIDCELYLFTFEEAARLLRMSKEKFAQQFIVTNKFPIILHDGRKFIRHEDLKSYLKENETKHVVLKPVQIIHQLTTR